MCLLGCAGCVRTVDFVEPFRARLSGGCVDCVRECFGKPPALLVWVVFR